MIGSIVSAAGSLVGAGAAIYNNERNIAFQKETNEKNEALMRESWAREDNAYQRKAADLKAAGLSQTLAAGGSGSAAGSPIQVKAPESKVDYYSMAQNALQQSMDFAVGEEKVKQAKEATELVKNEVHRIKNENSLLEQEVRQARQLSESNQIDLNMKNKVYDNYVKNYDVDKWFERVGKVFGAAGQGFSMFSNLQKGNYYSRKK